VAGTEAPGSAGPLPARRTDLEVADFGTELVVLDPVAHRAHHLDTPLAIVFDACDGRTTHAAVAGEVAAATGTDLDEAHRWVGRLVQILRMGQLVGQDADGSDAEDPSAT
jgi:hypothetical protein